MEDRVELLQGTLRLLDTIARRFEPWRQRHARLSRELRDQPYVLMLPTPPTLMS
jgi:hypothetical protein